MSLSPLHQCDNGNDEAMKLLSEYGANDAVCCSMIPEYW